MGKFGEVFYRAKKDRPLSQEQPVYIPQSFNCYVIRFILFFHIIHIPFYQMYSLHVRTVFLPPWKVPFHCSDTTYPANNTIRWEHFLSSSLPRNTGHPHRYTDRPLYQSERIDCRMLNFFSLHIDRDILSKKLQVPCVVGMEV